LKEKHGGVSRKPQGGATQFQKNPYKAAEDGGTSKEKAGQVGPKGGKGHAASGPQRKKGLGG